MGAGDGMACGIPRRCVDLSHPYQNIQHPDPLTTTQLASTVLHPLPYGLHLALRSLSYWASRSVPPYLAYRSVL